MEAVTTFITIALPPTAVLIGMYFTVKSFLTKEFEKKLIEVRLKNKQLIIPARLQAYERIILLLEGATPDNMIVRVNETGYTASELQQRILIELRQELNHNLSQQVYMSDQAWQLTKQAIQDVTTIVNKAAEKVSGDARGIELAKAIFEDIVALNHDPMGNAQIFIKNEIRQLY